MTINIPADATYLQMSFPSLIYSTVKIIAKYTSTDIGNTIDEVFDIKEKIVIPNGGLSASNIIINSNSTVTVISNTIVNHEWCISANIRMISPIVSIKIQKGNEIYGISYIEITPTKIVEKNVTRDLEKEYVHGLTIEDAFSVLISRENGSVKCVVMSASGVFTTNLAYFDGTDTVKVTNGNTDSITVVNATLDLTSGLCKKVMLFGDSYSDEHWGVADENLYGYTSVLRSVGADFSNVGYPGGTLPDIFYRFIGMGSYPQIIIWQQGMNYLSDTDGNTPDPTWLADLNNARDISESLGAVLIPCTIPSVSIRNNDAKNAYIRSNFKRYLDFDVALTNGQTWTSDNTNWISGYLSQDGVHPTRLGFAAMVAQAVKDVPELFNK